MITAYRHFGLNAPPFEGRPDPRYFYRSPAHAEALATLQFAVQTGKACIVVLGESGAGKTLLGRMLVQHVGPRTGVLWVHGIGQPTGETNATVCLPSSLADATAFGAQRIEEASLAAWIRTQLPRSPATVLIVDNADALTEHSWNDVLSVVTREVRTLKPITVVLLGLPTLTSTLALPGLVRLRRRIFRTCQLTRLARTDIAEYINLRLSVAGGNRETRIFTDAAIDLIQRLSSGNPALINQVCDNALVDAFGDERHEIDAQHIVATVQAITGGQNPYATFPAPPATGRYGPGALAGPAECRPNVCGPMQAGPGTGGMSELRPATGQTPSGIVDTYPTSPAAQSGMPEAGRPPIEIVSSATAAAADIVHRPLDARLQALESRLTDALTRVRVARARPEPSPDIPLEPECATGPTPVNDDIAFTPEETTG